MWVVDAVVVVVDVAAVVVFFFGVVVVVVVNVSAMEVRVKRLFFVRLSESMIFLAQRQLASVVEWLI